MQRIHRLKSVKLKITLRCDLDCSFCYLHDADVQDMSGTTLQRAMEVMERIDFKNIKVNGGEPTVAREFVAFSRALRDRFPAQKMILGTHGGNNSSPRVRDGLLCYDEVFLSTDSQHLNYYRLREIVVDAQRMGLAVTVQVVRDFITASRLDWLRSMASELEFRISLNSVVTRGCERTPRNDVRGPSLKCFDREIVIMPGGAVHRCCKKNLLGPSDGSLWSGEVVAEVLGSPPTLYPYCRYCDLYEALEASDVQTVQRRRLPQPQQVTMGRRLRTAFNGRAWRRDHGLSEPRHLCVRQPFSLSLSRASFS